MILILLALIASFIIGFFVANNVWIDKGTGDTEMIRNFKNPDGPPSIKGPTGPPSSVID